jgi:hypothetical protein
MKKTVLLLLLFVLALSSSSFACKTFIYGGVPRTCGCLTSQSGWCNCDPGGPGEGCTWDCYCVDGKCFSCGNGPTDGASKDSPLSKMLTQWSWVKDAQLAEQVRSISPALGVLILYEQDPATKKTNSTISGGTTLLSDDQDVWAEWERRLVVDGDTPTIHFRIVRLAYPNRVREPLEPAVRYERYTPPGELVISEHGWQVIDAADGKELAVGTF